MVNKKIKEEFTFKKGSFKEPFPHTMDIRNGTLAVIPAYLLSQHLSVLSPLSFSLLLPISFELSFYELSVLFPLSFFALCSRQAIEVLCLQGYLTPTHRNVSKKVKGIYPK